MTDAESPWGFAGESPAVATAPSVTLVRGTSFVICQRTGEIGGGPVDGVFIGDTRVCSVLRSYIDGRRIEPLTSVTTHAYDATFVGRMPSPAPGQGGLLVTRRVEVARGVCNAIEVQNLGRLPRSFVVQLEVGGDLAHVFAVKEGRADLPPAPVDITNGVLCIGERGDPRGAIVRADPAGELGTIERPNGVHGLVQWLVRLGPAGEEGSSWSGRLELSAVRHGEEIAVSPAVDGISNDHGWPGARLVVESDVAGLDDAVERAREDLGGLRIFDPEHPDEPVIAAGAPWFMTLFGRDSILTSWMALVLDPDLALTTARALARLQAGDVVAETEEEPGKILHEVRASDEGSLAFAHGNVYYGSADSTPLFVTLVGELHRWGVPLEQLSSLLPAVDRALGWIDDFGDRDGDGYIEYARATPSGLANQGWKDSWDGISFADGTLAEPPIALAEVQAYAYTAWLAGARLASAAGLADVAAARLERAAALRVSFNRDFWLEERGVLALALDADKRAVDAAASNMGHCLWAGILDEPAASAVARTLTGPAMASGWGIRTLATGMGRFDPLSYHNGSVWPHDTALCIAGLRRAGFVDEAAALTTDLLAAAQLSAGRLPELFAGLTRDEVPAPVPYPASCSPQAWASAAPLLLLRSLLGLDVDVPAGRLEIDPVLPVGATRMSVRGLRLASGDVDIDIDKGAIAVLGLPPGLAVVRPARFVAS